MKPNDPQGKTESIRTTIDNHRFHLNCDDLTSTPPGPATVAAEARAELSKAVHSVGVDDSIPKGIRSYGPSRNGLVLVELAFSVINGHSGE